MAQTIQLIFICDTIERLCFFSNLAKKLNVYNPIFVCVRLSTWLQAKRLSLNSVYPFFGFKKNNAYLSEDLFLKEILNSYEVKLGFIKVDEAYNLTKYLQEWLISYVDILNADKVLVLDWNGANFFSVAVRSLRSEKIQVGFFELSNVPGLYQLEPYGANAKSIWNIANDLIAVEEVINNNSPFRNNFAEAFKSKEKQILPPQIFAGKQANLVQIIDIIWGYISGVHVVRRSVIFRIYDRLLREIYIRKIRSLESTRGLSKYIFVPLQVSIDTNLICGSDHNNFDLIVRAMTRAKIDHSIVLVKLHPGERSGYFLKKLYDFAKKTAGVYFVDSAIKELVKNSNGTVTINSSVGWEAILYDQKVEVLGNCFYKKMNKSNLVFYMERALFNADNDNDASFIWSYLEKLALAKSE